MNLYVFLSKLVQFDGELREVLKLRRKNLYTENVKEDVKEDVTTYANQNRSKSRTAEWNMKS